MFEKIGAHTGKILFFIVNSLVAFIMICLMKEADKNSYELTTEEEKNFVPIDNNIVEIQKKIAVDRENRLRQLNNSSKELKQEEVTTTKTTDIPDPVVAPAPAPKTVSPTPTVAQPAPTKTTTPKPKADKKTKTS